MRRSAATVLALALAAAARGSPIPAEDLFKAAPIEVARLSPDGRHLGTIITDAGDRRNLVVFDVRDFKPEGLRASGAFEVSDFQWLTSSRVVFSIRRDKIYSWGLYAADIDRFNRYVPIDGFDGIRLIGTPASEPGEVLAWITQDSRNLGRPGPLVSLDASRNWYTPEDTRYRASITHTFAPPRFGDVVGWMTDQNGELALCTAYFRGRDYVFRYQPKSGSWQVVDMPPLTRVMAVDPDGRRLWVVTHGPRRGSQLRPLDMDARTYGRPVLTDATYDIGRGSLRFSSVSHVLAGVVYERRRATSSWFLPAFEEAQATIDAHRKDTDNVLVDVDRSERKFLFELTGPTHPTTMELLDLDSSKLNILDDPPPGLRGAAFRPVEPLTFRTRDGLSLEGYLTLPEGASKEHPVPLVVLVHGGPWARDTCAFNPEVQFLASRGYAVLQPNYRGSTGYSMAISYQSNYDYLRMGDDVTDATRDMLGLGLFDPRRVAIMGGSFGGYLAVCGVTFEPDLYRCAVTICGVFDWNSFIKSKKDVSRPGEYQILTDELGKPGRGNKLLERISPLDYVDRVRAPVFIAHGTEDQIVDVAQSKKLASALRARHVPCETFFRSVEAHGFYSYRDRVEFYHRVEAFLARYLGGQTLTAPR
ncbi:MAG TPA: alpha/beta fold hydrolase [Opitutaceae bacterium]|jgi:dipeptidyl aminopeptidase/acylaminoacyl peptidase